MTMVLPRRLETTTTTTSRRPAVATILCISWRCSGNYSSHLFRQQVRTLYIYICSWACFPIMTSANPRQSVVRRTPVSFNTNDGHPSAIWSIPHISLMGIYRTNFLYDNLMQRRLNSNLPSYLTFIKSAPFRPSSPPHPPPPTDICGGYLSFVVSILCIGIVTAVIGDVASHFGCTLGIKDSVTAIVFVALGTSIPGEWLDWKLLSFHSLIFCAIVVIISNGWESCKALCCVLCAVHLTGGGFMGETPREPGIWMWKAYVVCWSSVRVWDGLCLMVGLFCNDFSLNMHCVLWYDWATG